MGNENKSEKPTLVISGKQKIGADGDEPSPELNIDLKNFPLNFSKWLIMASVAVLSLAATSLYFFAKNSSCEEAKRALNIKLAEKETKLIKMQEGIGIDYDLSGSYFYITTPQNNDHIQVPCSNTSPITLKIGGTVEIDHNKDNKQGIRFLSGRRMVCVDGNRRITELLQKQITWQSEWGFIRDRWLRSLLKINDGNTGLVETQIPSTHNNETDFNFSGTMSYYSTSKKTQAIITDIHFFKCADNSDCNNRLHGRLTEEMRSQTDR